VGCKDGSILIYKIHSKKSSNSARELVTFMSKVKAHSSKVVSIGINFATGYIYSCANEKQVVLSEMNYGTVVKGNFDN